MLLVRGVRRQAAGITGAEGLATVATNQRQRAVQHEQPRVPLMDMRLAVNIRLDLAFADLIALATGVGLKFRSVHDDPPGWCRNSSQALGESSNPTGMGGC